MGLPGYETGRDGALDSHLLKPCLPQTLLDEVRRLIAIRRRGSVPPSAEVA